MPAAAAAATDGALAGAPSADRVGETPVASDRLNVRERRRADQYVGIKCAPVSSPALVPGCALARAGTRANRSAARDFAVFARIPRSSRDGRRNGRKKCSVVITLAGSLTASSSGGFLLRARSR